jgi:signal transduction histidine kinase
MIEASVTDGAASSTTPEFGDPRDPNAALRFMAHVSAVLAESLDYEATVAAVARLAVPFLGDLCLVDVLDDAGRMQRVAAAHRDPAVAAWQLQVRDQQRRWAGRDLAAEILAAGRGMLTPCITPEILEKYVENPEIRCKLIEIGVSSGITVPMLARGRALGAVILCLCNRDRRYQESDLAIAQELARRTAMALDNALLYRSAQDAVRARNEFLTVASHELNTPITSLLVLAQTLQATRAEMPEPVVERSLHLMVRQTRRLNRLVRELLDVTRVHSGALKISRERVDLVHVVGDVTAGLIEDATPGAHGIELRGPARIEGLWDRLCLEQILRNLVSNALKFGEGKPIEIVLEELEPGPDGRVRLQVCDQGIGIAEDRLPHIFGPFERAVSTANYGGLGLGLYIVKCLVRALQGKVEVESAAGAGSTFTVELPKTPDP